MDKIYTFVILVTLIILCTRPSFADNLDSSQYRIQFSNINFGSNNHSSASYDLGSTLGQLAAKEFSSAGYTVKAGFQYIHSIIPFTFSISDTSIELGTITPQTPATASTVLTVSFGGAGQYLVTAIEETRLQTFSGGGIIPDTSCNGGAQTCDETTANVWNSASAYGFGYNVSGDGAPATFTNGTYYRPFPDRSAAENPATVMSSSNVTASDQATVTFKVNVSNAQESGTYYSVVKFTATPSY